MQFADDVILVSKSMGEVKEMIEELNKAEKEAGLEVNVEKTKILTKNDIQQEEVRIGGKVVKYMRRIIVYLG